MRKMAPKLLLVFVLLIVTLACIAPVALTPDPGFIDTAIAQTHSVAASQTAQAMIPVTGPDTPTPTRASSATPFPTFTPVVFSTPEARVSINTNCRIGPGNVYAVVGVLQAGEAAQVVGRSADGNFWAIRNPDRPGETCWIPDQDATISGFTNLLPVFTPPPTVTPTRTRVPVLATVTRTRTSVPVFPPPARTTTPTSTPSITPTGVPSLSPSGAARFTLTPTDLPTLSPTFTLTPTDLASPSPTLTNTSTPSETPTLSSTPTPTGSATPTDLSSPTPIDTSTPSQTPTASATPTLPPTDTSTPSPTPTASATPTDLSSLSPTPSLTSTSPGSPTPTTDTPTPSQTPTPSATSTPTPTVTGTLSQTPTPSTTSTPTPTVTGTLTPGFTASYSGMENCPSLGWWLEFEVTNTGTAPFEFIALFVTDTNTGTFQPLFSSDFTNRNGCGTAITLSDFPPGTAHIISSAPFTYDPTGNALNARIVLCDDAETVSSCVSETINLTP